MAKTKPIPNEREYVINLRREVLKVPRHKRTPKAVKAVKQFIAKHMRIPDRNINKIKLDKYLNQELWFRGIRNPITKVKVKVKREGEFIKAELVDLPEKVKFEIARIKKAEEASKKKKSKEKKEEPKETKKEEPTESEKKEEAEKKESSKESKEKLAEASAKEAKHTADKGIKQPKVQPQRKALKK
tara:strand:- start:98 stop:655 length:558 start_codon:yes stop_codon:yes gene_type:complete